MSSVDLSQAIDLRVNHKLTYEKIGKIQGKSKQAIHRLLKPILPNDLTPVYKTNEADILTHTRMKLIQSIDKGKLKSASINNLAYAYSQFHNAERLIRGQSTQNVAYQDISANLKAIQNEIKELENDGK
jgi:hypothetical protein